MTYRDNDINQLRHNSCRRILISIAIILLFAMKGLTQIQGGVYNERKQEVSNALIIAKDTAGKIVDSVRSDKRGFYAFRSLKKGKYNIEAIAAGFILRVYKNIDVLNEEPAVEPNARNDISGATRLEIRLTPAIKPKQ